MPFIKSGKRRCVKNENKYCRYSSKNINYLNSTWVIHSYAFLLSQQYFYDT